MSSAVSIPISSATSESTSNSASSASPRFPRSTSTLSRHDSLAMEMESAEMTRYSSSSSLTPRETKSPRLPMKTLLISIGLFTLGIVFLSVGLHMFYTESLDKSLPFIIIGSISFIPGAYHTWLFYKIYKGDPGYSLDMIPIYDDEI